MKNRAIKMCNLMLESWRQALYCIALQLNILNLLGMSLIVQHLTCYFIWLFILYIVYIGPELVIHIDLWGWL